MKSIREWVVNEYRRLKAFIRRHAPYVILFLFLLGFFLIFFFERIVISIHPGELGVLWRWLGGGTQIDTVYREGAHVILPFNRMYVYMSASRPSATRSTSSPWTVLRSRCGTRSVITSTKTLFRCCTSVWARTL